MKRRNFLASTAAVAVVPLLPVLAAPVTRAAKTYFIGQDGFYAMADGERAEIIKFSPLPDSIFSYYAAP